jgi:hypothetical protein
MKRALTALALAGTLAIATIATPTSAHAQWRRREEQEPPAQRVRALKLIF